MSSHAPRLLGMSQSICLCSEVRITITIHAGASFRAIVVRISCISYHRLKVIVLSCFPAAASCALSVGVEWAETCYRV